MTKTYALFILFFLFSRYSFAQLITYPQPDCKIISQAYEVQVRQNAGKWQNTGIYNADVAFKLDAQHVLKKTSFTYFDCADSVTVRVKVNNKAVKNARVRPSAYGIVPKINRDFISFTMKASQYISLEINGDIFENLQIFANTIEQDPPKQGDADVLYYGPGIHNVGRVNVAANQTIYIAGGAIVEGGFTMDHIKNVKICGRGILTQLLVSKDTAEIKPGAQQPKLRNDQLLVNFSENVSISGITVLPVGYSAMIGQSKQVSISDFKAFSSKGNADGIDIFCSKDVSIKNIFMRNSDDCIAIYGHRWQYYGNTSNITVENATLWADVAHPLLIGTHGDSDNPDTLQNIKFRNITVLDQHENQLDYQGCIAINAGDSNYIKNVSFENIDIEDIRKGQLFNLRVMYNHKYNTSAGAGIDNVLFKNVSYNGTHANMSVICGYDSSHAIKNIVFENLKVNGTLVYDTMKGKPGFYKTGDMANIFIGEHVEGLKFIATN
ncbi:glycosyl hydrolase family 28 protein [Mucilaginibacter sp.]|uniref:glycosyl hydrolase family 28 protein n=1 Tax=Mucilaginibacter sp. TaxID=1882438 RepID=UPI003264424D